MSDPEWVRVTNDTQRLAVPGGWLYRVIYGQYVTLAFVPDPHSGTRVSYSPSTRPKPVNPQPFAPQPGEEGYVAPEDW